MKLLSCLVIVLFAGMYNLSTALADEQTLSSTQIQKLLNGNSIQGTWHGRNYTQTFYADGNTSYKEGNNRPTFGEWRVNAEKDTFESRWGGPSWTAYHILISENKYYWVPEVGEKQPFEMK